MRLRGVLLSGILLSLSGQTAFAADPAPKQAPVTWLAFCRDKPDAAAQRRQLLPAHLDYIDKIKDRIGVGGPFYDTRPGPVTGSAIIYRVTGVEEAKALLEADPLYPVFATCEWVGLSAYVGEWVGGWAGPYTPPAK